jgi:gliding motility-associated-like protein
MRLRTSIIFIFFICVSFCSVAQANKVSRLGHFQVNEIKGCAPFTVNITILGPNPFVCGGGNACDMFFGDTATPQSLAFFHVYTQPGTYTLKVQFGVSGSDDIQITVTDNTQPEFDLYTCGNNAVSVNITDTNYEQYVIDYNDGSSLVVVPKGNNAKDTHSFASSGTKNVTVRGRNLDADDNCNPTTKPIAALTTLTAPTITKLTVLDNSSLSLDFNGQPNVLYKLEISPNGGTSFQLYKNSYNVITETITNIKTEDNYYCFRLGAFDPCNNLTFYSAVICSSNFDLEIQNNQNNLTWVTSNAGVTEFGIDRKDSKGILLSTSALVSPYIDTDITCGVNYCYQIITRYPNGSESFSLEKCGTAISNTIPDAINNITAIVGQPGVALEWNHVTNFIPDNFSIVKSINGIDYQFSQTDQYNIKDDLYNTDLGICYKISYTDICKNQSPMSLESCPIRLSGNLSQDNIINLTWTAYTGWQSGVSSYTVEKYNQQGQLVQTYNTSSTTLTDDVQDLNNQLYKYVVKAIANEAGLSQAVSNVITIIKDPNLFYPTGFTPNGDNLNDVFNVFGQYITDFEMKIFNRWGELMFTTANLEEGWDGNFKGNAMPEGTYTFVANITDVAGRTFKRSGSVLLIRKK